MLATCRADLRASLGRAAATLTAAQGTDDPNRWTYDKQQDRIRSSTLGIVGVPTFDFQNRPTFQQIAAFTRSRRDVAPSTRPVAGPRPETGRLPATGADAALPGLAAAVLLLVALGRRRAARS